MFVFRYFSSSALKNHFSSFRKSSCEWEYIVRKNYHQTKLQQRENLNFPLNTQTFFYNFMKKLINELPYHCSHCLPGNIQKGE